MICSKPPTSHTSLKPIRRHPPSKRPSLTLRSPKLRKPIQEASKLTTKMLLDCSRHLPKDKIPIKTISLESLRVLSSPTMTFPLGNTTKNLDSNSLNMPASCWWQVAWVNDLVTLELRYTHLNLGFHPKRTFNGKVLPQVLL